jgi:dGTPase
MHLMNWPQLLTSDQLGRDAKPRVYDSARSAFRRDGDRVTFSSAFRRLQDKTQVFPLSDNDYVRTRLTHSLEVASVARSLGARVGAEICKRHSLEENGGDFGDIASAAALAHDLGNPPFGHSGEDAIRHWFLNSSIADQAKKDLGESQRVDIERYEGNAQGFRLVTRLQMPDNRGGLQLTCATLGAFTKYPRASVVSEAADYRGASAKKFGFYQSEAEFFDVVAARCGLIQRAEGARWWARHPIAFLVEAADDICYRLVDFEDGFRLGHLTYLETRDLMLEAMRPAHRPKRLDEIPNDSRRIQLIRAMAIGSAIEECAEVFLNQETEILAGVFDTPLIDAVASAPAWDEIIRVSRERIYNTPRGVEIEAAGFEVLGGLLDVFVSALNDTCSNGKPSPRSKKLLQLVPLENLGPDRVPDSDPYVRLMRILDFVSGMTDRYAVTLYKKVRGISLPGAA